MKRAMIYVASIGYVASLWAALCGKPGLAADIFGVAALLTFTLFIIFVCTDNKSKP